VWLSIWAVGVIIALGSTALQVTIVAVIIFCCHEIAIETAIIRKTGNRKVGHNGYSTDNYLCGGCHAAGRDLNQGKYLYTGYDRTGTIEILFRPFLLDAYMALSAR